MKGEKEHLSPDGGRLQRPHAPRVSPYTMLNALYLDFRSLDGAAISAGDTMPHIKNEGFCYSSYRKVAWIAAEAEKWPGLKDTMAEDS